jgi:hypothetical protein
MKETKMNIEQTVELEKSLLTPEVRASYEKIDLLLADDFSELGASGDKFGKDFVLAHLPEETEATRFEGRDFNVREISPGVALVTFFVTKTSREGTKHSLRSSLWVWRDNRWQMTYHQGTLIPS